MTTFVFDIDGTICTNTNGEYYNAVPYRERITIINELYRSGNEIIFFTARGMGTTQNNVQKASEKWRTFTEAQLYNWKVEYHFLFFGKPAGDIYIDDKGKSDSEFFKLDIK